MSEESPDRRETRSKSGNPIYQYDLRPPSDEIVHGDQSLIDAVEKHLDRVAPEEGWVFHEIVSTTIHIDIHIRPPTQERSYWLLVTSGMAERPMKQPAGVEGCEFCELCICLPPDWPGMAQRSQPQDPAHPWKDDRNYWPIRWLKTLARFPHEYDTWLWMDHTIPNGDPPEPFPGTAGLAGWILGFNPLLGQDFIQTRVGDRDVYFWTLMPLTAAEMQFKLDHGAEKLWERLDAIELSPVIDPNRPCAISGQSGKKPWWKFFEIDPQFEGVDRHGPVGRERHAAGSVEL